MSALPKSVRKQIEAAEKAHAEAYKKDDAKPEGEQPEVTDEQKPEEAGQEVQPQETAEAQPPVTPEQPAAEGGDQSAAEASGKPEHDAAYWENRFKIMEGKYKSEIPRQQNQIRDLKQDLTNMRDVMAQMKQQAPAAPASDAEQKPPAGTPQRLLKPEEIADYGDELISVIQRGAQEVFNPEVAALREEISQLKKQLGGVSQTLTTSQRDSVLDVLTREVPDWKSLNEDEMFLHWLDQTDTFSGEPRQKLLDRAFESADAARVVAFFKGYLNESAALQPPPQVSAPPARNPQTKLDDMVAPGKPKGQSGGAQKGDKRMWTQQQIAQFYQDVNKGKYKNQPDKQAALEHDIVAAGREGRITT